MALSGLKLGGSHNNQSVAQTPLNTEADDAKWYHFNIYKHNICSSLYLEASKHVAGVGRHVHQRMCPILQHLVMSSPHIEQLHMDECRIAFHVSQCRLQWLQVLAVEAYYAPRCQMGLHFLHYLLEIVIAGDQQVGVLGVVLVFYCFFPLAELHNLRDLLPTDVKLLHNRESLDILGLLTAHRYLFGLPLKQTAQKQSLGLLGKQDSLVGTTL